MYMKKKITHLQNEVNLQRQFGKHPPLRSHSLDEYKRNHDTIFTVTYPRIYAEYMCGTPACIYHSTESQILRFSSGFLSKFISNLPLHWRAFQICLQKRKWFYIFISLTSLLWFGIAIRYSNIWTVYPIYFFWKLGLIWLIRYVGKLVV